MHLVDCIRMFVVIRNNFHSSFNYFSGQINYSIVPIKDIDSNEKKTPWKMIFGALKSIEFIATNAAQFIFQQFNSNFIAIFFFKWIKKEEIVFELMYHCRSFPFDVDYCRFVVTRGFFPFSVHTALFIVFYIFVIAAISFLFCTHALKRRRCHEHTMQKFYCLCHFKGIQITDTD